MQKLDLLMGVLKGIAYLHKNGIAHLDVKPQNILIDANEVAKISDFGTSEYFISERVKIIILIIIIIILIIIIIIILIILIIIIIFTISTRIIFSSSLN